MHRLKRPRLWSPISWRGLGLTICFAFLGVTNGYGQSRFSTTNRYELDPPLDGVWIVPDEENPILVSFTKLESSDLDIQIDELRRVNQFSPLVSSGQREQVVAWALKRLEEMTNGTSPSDRTTTRLLAQALITAIGLLGDAEQADFLWKLAQQRSDLSLQIEMVLIDWKNRLPLETWQSRIAKLDGDWQAIAIAIRGMEALDEATVAEDLVRLLSKPNLPLPIRVEASRVLGKLQPSGLESLAQDFFSSITPSKDLLAANLLSQHNSNNALALQLELLKSGLAPAVNVAYQSISDFHPQKGVELAKNLVNHKEYSVRQLVIGNLASAPVEANLRLLGTMLQDPNVGLRDQARESLVKLVAAPEIRSVIDSIVDEKIESDNVATLEQAIIMAVQLNRNDLCQALLRQLHSDNEIISIRAAWALQELASEESVVSQIFEFVSDLTMRLKEGAGISPTSRLQLTYLLHVFGTNRYLPAEPLLREYVPELEQKMTPHARAAAIWALGKIHQGSQDSELTRQLEERFFDLGPPFAEYTNVRYACAVTLARLGAMEDPTSLRGAGGTVPYKMGVVVEWAIEHHGKFSKP